MLPITAEWTEKAEADWSSAQVLYRARKYFNYDGACFHAQQCAEKYLKARLVEAAIAFPPTHNLIHLLNLALVAEPAWGVLDPDVRALMVYAVAIRYPGTMATRTDARAAIASAHKARDAVRAALGLPE